MIVQTLTGKFDVVVIIKNIEFGRALGVALKHKYKVILYRDIAARPIDTARDWLSSQTNTIIFYFPGTCSLPYLT